jgi:hypothetical protein
MPTCPECDVNSHKDDWEVSFNDGEVVCPECSSPVQDEDIEDWYA